MKAKNKLACVLSDVLTEHKNIDCSEQIELLKKLNIDWEKLLSNEAVMEVCRLPSWKFGGGEKLLNLIDLPDCNEDEIDKVYY